MRKWMQKPKRKVMHFVKLIKQYKELALTARDARKFSWKEGGDYVGE